jgi:hypothetical protein
MSNIEKSRQAVNIMLRETMEDKITWNVSHPPRSVLEAGIKGNIYCAIINDKNIRLFKYQVKKETHYKLEMYDINNELTIWTFPHTDSIRNLYDQVARQFPETKRLIHDQVTCHTRQLPEAEKFIENFLEAYNNKP